jgi:hypothetical protein
MTPFVKHDLKGSVEVYRVENCTHYSPPTPTDVTEIRRESVTDVTDILATKRRSRRNSQFYRMSSFIVFYILIP